VRITAIGDVIMTIPAVERLKRERGGEIWWICGSISAPILRRFPFIDRVIEVNERKLLTGNPIERLSQLLGVWRALAGRSFDTCNLLQYDDRYRILNLPVFSRRTLILKKGNRLTQTIPGRNVCDEYARLMLGLDGPLPTRIKPILMPGLPEKESGKRLRIGLVPGGARNTVRDSPQRRWPLPHYRALAERFLAAGMEVTLLGASSDRWALPEFEALPVHDKLGACSVVESIELISQLDLLVTHDTGLLHMAGLTPTPVVALFGPTSPREFLPNTPNIEFIWGGELLACRPCYDGRDLPDCRENICLTDVLPEVVFDKSMAALERFRAKDSSERYNTGLLPILDH